MTPMKHSRRDFLKASMAASVGLASILPAHAKAAGGSAVQTLAPDLPWPRPHRQLAEQIAAMPKVELHVHLEGSMTPETVWTLAERNRIRLPASELSGWRDHYRFRDFNHFIEVYQTAAQTLQTAEDFAFLVERFCADQAQQRIYHSEAFFSASLHLGKLPDHDLADALAEGARRGMAAHAVSVVLIPDIARQEPNSAERVLEFILAARRRHPAIFIGLGLGGKEAGFPPALFQSVFEQARAEGLRVVAHAGETTGPAGIREAIELLRAERIGHGLHCLEEPTVTAILRERSIPLEVCPASNYRTKAWPRGEPHPIRRMVDAQLICTVNSDDPPMFDASLNLNYELLASQGFSWAELWQLNQNGIDSAFLPEVEKVRLRALCAPFAAGSTNARGLG